MTRGFHVFRCLRPVTLQLVTNDTGPFDMWLALCSAPAPSLSSFVANSWDFLSCDVMTDLQVKGGAGWHKLAIEGTPPTPRGWFAATAVPGGMLVHGGNSPTNERLQDMYILNLH